METVRAHDVEVPALGLGTWQLVGDDCRQAVDIALGLGYRHIDTAQMYGNEAEVGAGIAAGGVDREELWLATKIDNGNHGRERVGASIEDSLRQLGTDYIDLLLIHWPVHFERLPETLEAMRGLQERGLARHLGVSNFTPAQVKEAQQHVTVLTDQVEHHPYLGQAGLHAMAAQDDFFITAYSPLARGRVVHDETLREIGEAHGVSAGQVTLRFLLQHGRTAVIPKATSREHLAANIDLDGLVLSEEEMERIGGLERGERIIDPPFAPDWEE